MKNENEQVFYTEDGKEIRIRKEEDGISYQWDEEKRAWFPMFDEQLVASQQSAYGTEVITDETEVWGKQKRKREKVYTGVEDDKAAEKKPKAEPKKKVNTSVYVTGLPLDTTPEEMREAFEKYGILMEDPVTGEPKIKLYKDEIGRLKGDALVTYFKPESVQLCISLLDDTEFRYGETSRIRIQEAVFKEKEPNSSGSSSTNPAGQKPSMLSKDEKKKFQQKYQKLEKRLDWYEDEGGKKSAKSSKIVVMKHMFTKKEIDKDPTLLIDLKEEVREECAKLGEVTNVTMYDHSDDGVITVRFKEPEAAEQCVQRNNGRFFGGQQIIAYIYDGKEKFKETKTKEDIEAEEAKRLAAYEQWLESQH